MNRNEFIKTALAATGVMSMTSLRTMGEALRREGPLMPVLFIGHGSPMNGIENNLFSAYWEQLGRELPVPRAVLVVSAHWLTRGTHVTAMEQPKTIHDFGGFPRELFEVQYPAPGSPEVATETQTMITSTAVGLDHDWGLDHGTWSIVRRMYPEATIPVLQLSIDYAQPPRYHYELARELAGLRRKGVLIIGSGNMVHNLRMVEFDRIDEPGFGFDWALEINEVFKRHIAAGTHDALIDYSSLGSAARLAIPTPDHYYPLLYTLGLQEATDDVGFFNDHAVGGSLTMTSVRIG
ncbi:MAG TPA: 4,5-DOPA dioxygenase extradiol [Candidatus Kapabacteria bacterium]|jgi:4,5-DOPA dioxygenase extradiol|nr:4,5-DOPA dioxygenase extradiol [Candidatus Kapabacteria bacterium]